MSTAAAPTPYKTWMCLVCGFVYDEAAGWPDDGLAPGTRWADVPANWSCPECGARKDDFEMVEL
jgi:rubredoxin